MKILELHSSIAEAGTWSSSKHERHEPEHSMDFECENVTNE